jgi:3-dehydroquinate dehydratase-2
MSRLLLLNGPNLNLLGKREPTVYGDEGLTAVESRLKTLALDLGHDLDCYQHNAEHELVSRVQACGGDGTSALIVNPGAYTHSSIALRDALLGIGRPFVEVHLSNVYAREGFRHRSFFSDVAEGTIVGLGVIGYELALLALHRRLADN